MSETGANGQTNGRTNGTNGLGDSRAGRALT